MLKWLFLLAAACLWAHSLRAQDCKGRLAFSKVQKGGKTYFYALNKDSWWPIHLTYNFSLFGNSEFSTPLPGRRVLRPRQKVLLGWIRYKPGPGRSGYQSDFQYGFGDPAAVPDPKAVPTRTASNTESARAISAISHTRAATASISTWRKTVRFVPPGPDLW